MLKVLFIGGTGVISSSVTELAARSGDIRLSLFNRGSSERPVPGNVSLIRGDIRNGEETRYLLKKHSFDVVVEWIAYVPDHIKADLELFKGRVGQYIFISSASAYMRPPPSYMVTESVPLANPYWKYSRDKIACEELLKEQGGDFPVTIVRPSYTYDKTAIPYIFNSRKYRYTLIDRIRKGKGIIVPGDGTSLFTITHSRDFAKGFTGLIGNKHAIGQDFHITSDEVLSWDAITDMIGDAAGARPDKVHIPSEMIAAAAPEYEGGLLGDKSYSMIFDNSKIKKFVPGYMAKTPFDEGIRESVKWFDSNPEMCRSDKDFNDLCDDLISRIRKASAL